MSSVATPPDTIVLIHGFWVTPRSWEDWKAYYEAKGFTVLTPAYPGFEVEVEALNADPTPIVDLRVPALVEHLESVVGGLERPPILIGHSAGGAFTQILMDHGFGAAGVAINSAPTEGVKVVPATQIKATFPVLNNPANHHKAVGYDLKQWTYAFTNTFTEEQSKATYERYHVPASGRILWDSVLANVEPGHQGTWVDYKNDDRAPLLFISGTEDNLMPPRIQQSNAKHYKSDTVTEIKEFEGPHLLPMKDGWEEVADYALTWALEHASAPQSASDVRITHIGGPTVLIEVEGWRILSDPTFDPPGRTYKFGWGTSSRKTTGPAIPSDELGPIDVVLISHDNHGDNLDDAGRGLLPSAGTIVTTTLASSRLGVPARGLEAWQHTVVEDGDRPSLTITATPCRHGPPLSRPIVGHVVGFALAWEGQRDGVLWISGDTVLYDGVREVADRLDIGIALLHLGEVQFPITGPVRYSMTAAEGVELCGLVQPEVAIPVHYEGWSHFHEGRAEVERAISAAPSAVGDRFHLLTIGAPASFTV